MSSPLISVAKDWSIWKQYFFCCVNFLTNSFFQIHQINSRYNIYKTFHSLLPILARNISYLHVAIVLPLSSALFPKTSLPNNVLSSLSLPLSINITLKSQKPGANPSMSVKIKFQVWLQVKVYAYGGMELMRSKSPVGIIIVLLVISASYLYFF